MFYIFYVVTLIAFVGCVDSGINTDVFGVDFIYGDHPFAMKFPHLLSNNTEGIYRCLNNPIIYYTNGNGGSMKAPFLYVFNANWYIFYSHNSRSDNYESIGCSVSSDYGNTWNNLDSVMKMPLDLGNPIVFLYENQHFMIASSKSHLQLFKSQKNFPRGWEKVNDVHPNHYTHPSMLQYDNTWWLFVNYNQGGRHHLHVLYSDSPIGPYRGHPNNCMLAAGEGGDAGSVDNFVCLGGKSVIQPHMTTSNNITSVSVSTKSTGKFVHYNGSIYRVTKHLRGMSIFKLVHIGTDKPITDMFVSRLADTWTSGKFQY
mgnify:CR=1 FL=1